jgi:hypothetical protein
MARLILMFIASWALSLPISGCVATPNGLDPHGDTLLFKTFGQFDSAIGKMELVKGLGLPYSVQNNLGHVDFSKPIIFLPKDVVSVSLRDTYRVGTSTITVISAPTQECQYSYILININPDKTYFGRRIQPCDHDVRFTSDGGGVTVVEQSVPDPRWWWMSNTRVAGPILQSTLLANRPAQALSSSSTASVASASSGGDNPSSAQDNRSGLSLAPPHAPLSKPRPVKPPKATPSVHAGASEPSNTAPQQAPAKRLQYVSKVAMSFSMTARDAHEATHICLADGSTCAQ